MTAEKIAPAANGGRWKNSTGIISPKPRRGAMPGMRATRAPGIASPYLCGDALYDAAVRVATYRARLELALVEALAADPLHSSRLVCDETMTDLIRQSDLLHIAQSIAMHGERGKESTARVARLALRYYGEWDDTDTRTFTRGPLWSDYSLSALFHCRAYLPSTVRTYVRRLRDLSRRERTAAACHRRALRVLDGAMDGFAAMLMADGGGE